MKWSRYNLLFESHNHGWLLFNSVSRAFMKVEAKQLETIQSIAADPQKYDFSSSPILYIQLRDLGFLVSDSQDDDTFNIKKMKNLTSLYGDRRLYLTLAVTRACNFDCSYCFERDHNGQPMSEEVEDKLIRFIKRHQMEKLHITWYGGEPLLAFDRILSINKRLQDMNMQYNSIMVTNGYLLDEKKIARLNDLHVGYLQITLDGNEETHNGRRYLRGGGRTYQTILQNVGKVLTSDYRGTIHIRVNVDERNEDEFADVYRYFRDNYPNQFGKKLTVYPGFVKGDDHPDCSCFFDSVRQGKFLLNMYRKYGIAPMRLFPSPQQQSCILTRRNAYVVGPDGELYKCWDDVGIPEKVVGTLDMKKDWNMSAIAEGMVGCSYLDDPECRECFYFPICNGGCHAVRMKNLHREVKQSPCTYFKGNIEELLELFYEIRLKNLEEKKQAESAKQEEAEAMKQGVTEAALRQEETENALSRQGVTESAARQEETENALSRQDVTEAAARQEETENALNDRNKEAGK